MSNGVRPSLGSVLFLAAAIGLAVSGCSSTGGSSAGDGSTGDTSSGGGGLSCKLGGGCSKTQLCMGGIACSPPNCQPQCLDGTWQNPCPADLPQTGRVCAAEGAYCGYSNVANECGADNCYCQGGAWSCGPTCIIDASAVDDGGSDGGCGADANCPADYTCFEDGGVWRCPGNSSPSPACPPGAGSGASCDYDGGGCFSCSEGAGIECGCAFNDGGDAGAAWLCIGAGYACR
jgi:hypothetical protein